MAGMRFPGRPTASVAAAVLLLAAAALLLAVSCVEPLGLVSVVEQRIDEANYVPTGKLAVYVHGDAVEDGAAVDFPEIPVTAETPVVIRLANEGDGVLNFTTLPRAALGGSDAAHFRVAVDPPAVLNPGDWYDVDVYFKPTVAGGKTSTLVFANDGRSSRAFALSLSGTADSEPAPVIGLSQEGGGVVEINSAVAFPGTIQTKMSEPLEFQIRNNGTADLVGCSVDITGPDASAFSVALTPAAEVGSGQSKPFRLVFSPSAVRSYSAAVTVNSNDHNYPHYTFNVSGEGTEWHGIANFDLPGDVGAGTSIGVAGSTAHIAYNDASSQSLKIMRSADGGLSWPSTYSPNPGAGGAAPSLVIAGDDVFVSYMAGTSLRVAKGAGGTSWSHTSVAADVTALSGDAALAWNGAALLVGYGKALFNGYSEMYYASSADGIGWSSARVASTRRGYSCAVGSGLGSGSDFFATSYGSWLWLDRHSAGGWLLPENIGSTRTSSPDLAMATGTQALVAYVALMAQDLVFVSLPSGAPVTVESSVDVGSPSIACTPGGGTIHISYYDATDKDLELATSTDGGAHWSRQTVDSVGDVGLYSSVAVEGETVYISYYDATNKDLKLAKSLDGGASW